MSTFTVDRATRMRELLSRFKLPTVAAEVVRRLTDAGHDAALSTLLEVFEAEADERAQRRTERLRRTSRLGVLQTHGAPTLCHVPDPVQIVGCDPLQPRVPKEQPASEASPTFPSEATSPTFASARASPPPSAWPPVAAAASLPVASALESVVVVPSWLPASP